jgi:hypothetical protein
MPEEIAANLSSGVSYDQDRPSRMLHFHDSNSVPSEQFFNTRRFVIAVLKPDDHGRRTSLLSKPQKIGISCYDDESAGSGIFPDGLIRRKLAEGQLENVGRFGKEFGKAANQLR